MSMKRRVMIGTLLITSISFGIPIDGTTPEDIKTTQAFIRHLESLQHSPPRTRNISHADKLSLTKTVAEIVTAFSNRQEEVIRKLSGRFVKDVADLSIKDYEEIEDPAYRTFFREFEIRQNARVVDVVLASFSKPDEFTKYIRTLFAMARLLGEATLARKDYRGVLLFADAFPLRHLKRYKKMFLGEKRLEMVAATDRLITVWIGQIESEHGFIREYMRHDYELNMPLVKFRKVSYRDMLWAVRVRSLTILELEGYRPKWADTEFPLPALTREDVDAAFKGGASSLHSIRAKCGTGGTMDWGTAPKGLNVYAFDKLLAIPVKADESDLSSLLRQKASCIEMSERLFRIQLDDAGLRKIMRSVVLTPPVLTDDLETSKCRDLADYRKRLIAFVCKKHREIHANVPEAARRDALKELLQEYGFPLPDLKN